MISRRHLPELRDFARVEMELPIAETPEFRSLVVPNGNSTRPGHRWFKYKEAFSADLMGCIAERLNVPTGTEIQLLDPFCGAGTALLSAQHLSSRGYRFRGVGIECNPLSALVARAKLSWSQLDVPKFQRAATTLLRTTAPSLGALPALTSITTGRCISETFARHIVGARERITRMPPSVEREALMVGLASTIEPLSKVRRDGRALRIVEKQRTQFLPELKSRFDDIAYDAALMQRSQPLCPKYPIYMGDGRDLAASGIRANAVDLIVTSPPYPNNIDYNEIYKLEIWLLGLATNAEEFLELRRKTFRSHPTCSPPELAVEFSTQFERVMRSPGISPLIGMISHRVAEIEKLQKRGRQKVLLGYAYDTWQSLRSHFQSLRRKGTAVYVVGNSLHGGAQKPYLIPTDLLYARLAEAVGFTVENVMIARPLQRRVSGNHFLRDSVVVVRKP